MIGRGYVIDYCVSSFLNLERKKIFETYLSSCLRNINEILAVKYGGHYITKDYVDIVGYNRRKEEESKSAEDIVLEVIRKAGLKLGTPREGNVEQEGGE